MFVELLRQRRSVRRYQARPVPDETVALLVEAALRAPSSRGNRPWEFIVVRDPDTLERLSLAKRHGSSFLKGAPLAIVVCADPAKSDVWVEDASIAAAIVHLAAADLGLGSCWIQIRERPHDDHRSADRYVAGLLGLREGLAVEAIIAVGYADEAKAGHPTRTLLFDRVSYGRYGQTARPDPARGAGG